jgi:hypothetical protein
MSKILPTAPENGQICYCRWGYGQTNIDWYVVTAVLPKSIRIAPIKGTTKETGFMCGDALPKQPIERDGEEELRRWRPSEHYGWVASMKFGCLTPWDGRPHYCSWYN